MHAKHAKENFFSENVKSGLETVGIKRASSLYMYTHANAREYMRVHADARECTLHAAYNGMHAKEKDFIV